MSALVMVVERVDAETGEVIESIRGTAHGWASPEAAVSNWKARVQFEAYRNGRITRNPNTGVDVRAFFDVPEPGALLDLTPTDQPNRTQEEK
jgi:hypothetical protein